MDAIVADMLWTGDSEVLLKSANEPAMLQLLAEALKRLKEEKLEIAYDEKSIPYDSQSNGEAEMVASCYGVRLALSIGYSAGFILASLCLHEWLNMQRR